MAEKEITLPNGRTVVVDPEGIKLETFALENLYSYRLMDDGSDIVINPDNVKGKFLAKEDDYVISYKLGTFRVSRTDYTSYYNELVKWDEPSTPGDVSVEDVLLGVGPGYTDETYRVYIDTRVFPFRLDIDSRLKSNGSQGKEVRVFKGINTTETGTAISAMYNQSGDIVSDAIPLQLVKTQNVTNISEKCPVEGYTTAKLDDGELVTVVTYNSAGAPTAYSKMLVHNTNLTRHPEEGMKRVKSIELISPYLSKTEPGVLLVPINVTVATLAMRAKVTYIDGKTAVLDVVDETANGKFKLLGLMYWSPTITGQEQQLVLTYQLSVGEEYAYLQGETYNGAVTANYVIRTMPVDYAYSLKVYAFPTWTGAQSGYALDYWLCDLTRQIFRRVPKGAVSLQEGSASFDGLNYTSTQHLGISIDLSVMDEQYGDHVHVQNIQIALLRDGGINLANWKVKFADSQTDFFGNGLNAIVKAAFNGLSTINFSNGFTTKADWLKAMYYGISPLYDPQTEVQAPEPTHFIITSKTKSIRTAIALWDNDITIQNETAEGETIYLKWVKETAGGTDLALGVSGFPVHQTSTNQA